MEPSSVTRRHDVDWLRNLAFILLIFYHIGMFYVQDWDWHVKSSYQSESLQNWMILVNQWRMPLIFLISGIALSLVEGKIRQGQLLKLRFLRIFIPLVAGMYFIVPLQSYYEAIQKLGYSGGYWSFWLEYINPATHLYPEHHNGPLGLLTWNHLWYLAYIWHYTLIYLIIRPVLKPLTDKLSNVNIHPLIIFLLPVVPLMLYTIWLKPLYPRTHALVDDWYIHAFYLTFFLLGYVIAKAKIAWQSITELRRVWLCLAIVGYAVIYLEHNKIVTVEESDTGVQIFGAFWGAANRWAWMLMVVGYAGAYLNKPNKLLGYLNQAVLPWYILHQSVIILLAMNLSPLQLGGFWESTVLVVGTFVACAVTYEVIRRMNLLRFVFGMKMKASANQLPALKVMEKH